VGRIWEGEIIGGESKSAPFLKMEKTKTAEKGWKSKQLNFLEGLQKGGRGGRSWQSCAPGNLFRRRERAAGEDVGPPFSVWGGKGKHERCPG